MTTAIKSLIASKQIDPHEKLIWELLLIVMAHGSIDFISLSSNATLLRKSIITYLEEAGEAGAQTRI